MSFEADINLTVFDPSTVKVDLIVNDKTGPMTVVRPGWTGAKRMVSAETRNRSSSLPRAIVAANIMSRVDKNFFGWARPADKGCTKFGDDKVIYGQSDFGFIFAQFILGQGNKPANMQSCLLSDLNMQNTETNSATVDQSTLHLKILKINKLPIYD